MKRFRTRKYIPNGKYDTVESEKISSTMPTIRISIALIGAKRQIFQQVPMKIYRHDLLLGTHSLVASASIHHMPSSTDSLQKANNISTHIVHKTRCKNIIY